jgi:hypothetical protein
VNSIKSVASLCKRSRRPGTGVVLKKGVRHINTYGTSWGGYALIEVDDPAAFARYLEAFIVEHEYSGEMDGRVDGDRIWMTCTCGTVIDRHADRD